MLTVPSFLALNYYSIRSVYFPNPSLCANLPIKAQIGLQKANLIVSEIILKYFNNDQPTIKCIAKFEESDICQFYGTKKYGVIQFGIRALDGISEIYNPIKKAYKNAWEEQVAALSDDLITLSNQINHFSEEKAASLIGLFEECTFLLSDEELYFILKHEILGHLQNRDTEARLRLKLMSGIVCLLVFEKMNQMFVKEVSAISFFASLFISFLVSSLFVKKLEHKQEYRADLFAVINDSKAQRGAHSFLKKLVVFELATERYYQLTGKVIDSSTWGIKNFKQNLRLGHPTAADRFKNLATVEKI